MASSKHTRLKNSTEQSKFIENVEVYLAKANWTKQQFMAAIQVGEAQYFRWKNSENTPTKALVNRIAVVLARRLDEVNQALPRDPFPFSDEIDSFLNELLEAAGYSASVRGKKADSSWLEINRKKEWTLGYTSVGPNWAMLPESASEMPTGIAIELAEKVGRLLGLKTNFLPIPWPEVYAAISDRKVHGIVPFMLDLPRRQFAYRLSDPWRAEGALKPAAVTPRKVGVDHIFEDLQTRHIELFCVENELGSWILNTFDERTYKRNKKHEYPNLDKAISDMKAIKLENSEVIPVFCSDHLLCEDLARKNGWEVLRLRDLDGFEFYPSFAFHSDEEQLTSVVNSVLNLLQRRASLASLAVNDTKG